MTGTIHKSRLLVGSGKRMRRQFWKARKEGGMRCDEPEVSFGSILFSDNQQMQGIQMELNLKDSPSHHHEQGESCCE